MSLTEHFKKSARELSNALDRAGINLDTYQLLNLTDQLVAARLNFATASRPTYDQLVERAVSSQKILNYLSAGHKASAVKELIAIARSMSDSDNQNDWLRACTNAIKDSRVVIAAELNGNPWMVTD